MRTFFRIFPAYALVLAAGSAAPSAFAQAADDDPYGVPGGESSTSPEASVPSVAPQPDTARTPAVSAAPDTAPPVPRARVTRETTINPLDAQRGAYRNPKKALFMSLVLPGLGQAYVGQSAFNYSRAALYFGTEVTLGVLWYHYTAVKYDRQTKRYRRFADEHWSLGKYEDRLYQETPMEEDAFNGQNPHRGSYCDAVQESTTGPGQKNNRGCKRIFSEADSIVADYQFFAGQHEDRFATPDSAALRGALRAGFADPIEFYALIGAYQEFIAGWDDAAGVAYSADSIAGTSAHRAAYNAMRRKAQDYSRMQAWFIGGIVLNHIASAVDAALAARHNNKRLYEGEARWYDRLNVDGGLAFDAGTPRTYMTARLSF